MDRQDWQHWLGDTARFAELRAQYDTQGYLVFPSVLSTKEITELRTALDPYLAADIHGRNDFEGMKTNRVYAMLAKSPVFAKLAIHPLVLAFAEAELGRECLLSACLAINIHPGETVQPWHYDDGHYRLPRPRPAYGVSAFWTIDETTEETGATEILPGSHLWPEQQLPGASSPTSFTTREFNAQAHDPGARPDAVKAVMPAGSLMIAKSTLWHRGGANRSDKPRLIITPQYCVGWGRQLENMILAVPPEIAATLPERARELIGYSIHPPFMGYVDGVHPARVLQ
jgi:ectoine hydroxylase-related dioxygenase (phytanoyl-CoA dioxygenase family)